MTHKQAVLFVRSQVPAHKIAGLIIHSILHTSFINTVVRHSKFSDLVCRIVYLELSLMVLLWQAQKTVQTTGVTRRQYTKRCYRFE
jgi:hypothetical protein